MPKGSFAAFNATTTTQSTEYYDNGHDETFSIPIASTELAPLLSQLLNQSWLSFQLADQTVVINMSKVEKVEFKPPILELAGEGVFLNSQRVTALHRGAAGRFKVDE